VLPEVRNTARSSSVVRVKAMGTEGIARFKEKDLKKWSEERGPEYQEKCKYQIVSALLDINGTMNEFSRKI
jgi:hypothetical protein